MTVDRRPSVQRASLLGGPQTPSSDAGPGRPVSDAGHMPIPVAVPVTGEPWGDGVSVPSTSSPLEVGGAAISSTFHPEPISFAAEYFVEAHHQLRGAIAHLTIARDGLNSTPLTPASAQPVIERLRFRIETATDELVSLLEELDMRGVR
jgi:hypothetical protein